MRVQWLRASLVISAIALIAASGRAGDEGGGEDGGEEQPPPTGNKVQFDAKSPTAFNIGEIKSTGTVTIGSGWTCDAVIVRIYDSMGKKIDEKQTAVAPNPSWSITISGLPAGTHKVIATGYFRKGMTADTPKVEAVLTVK